MQHGLRSIQRPRNGAATEDDQNRSNGPNAEQLHPANILSTLDFVLRVRPWASHFVLSVTVAFRVVICRRPGNIFLPVPLPLLEAGCSHGDSLLSQ
jgi:hypothetical protein